MSSEMSSVEICSGAGGQALGLERAGFSHEALVEIENAVCETLRLNRPSWNIVEEDLLGWSGKAFEGVDLLAGGVPCPPFSKAGKQLGKQDERNLFPKAIELVDEIRPKAVMLENVRGLLDAVFDTYREEVESQLIALGYTPRWRLLNASDYGVSQLRPRVVSVGIRNEFADHFHWPTPSEVEPQTVGNLLLDLMGERGWKGAEAWASRASTIAPTLVGGSKKHGGPDLGPTRARAAWASLGVDSRTLADQAPGPGFQDMPRLTVRMAACVQGFPDSWGLFGRKTAAYRQVGNAFPPPVAEAVARRNFHAGLLSAGILGVNANGVPSNADSSNKASVEFAKRIANSLSVETVSERLAGQTSGGGFEQVCTDFLSATFPKLSMIRPGDWQIRRVNGRGSDAQASIFEQYAHLVELDVAIRINPQLQSILGNGYTIAPDVVISRSPVSDDFINDAERLVDDTVSRHASIRSSVQRRLILHAVVSCKWTIRSDRAQNSRSEALSLIRNRKGRLPHIAVVTGEPLPSRIASIALGTGDIDCVYHFALPELLSAVEDVGHGDAIESLKMMIEGKRLKDISDLPLDLAV